MTRPAVLFAELLAVVISVAITVALLFFMDPASPASWPLRVVIVTNTILILFTGGRFLYRFRSLKSGKILSRKGGLTQRFVSRFSIAAIIPACIVALLLLGNVVRGIDNWFSERVETSIDRAVVVGKTNLDRLILDLDQNFQAISTDINNAIEGFRNDQNLFQDYLNLQVEARNFSSAWIINSNSIALAQSELEDGVKLPIIDKSSFVEAVNGSVVKTLFEDVGVVAGLSHLDQFGDDIYLLVLANIDRQYLADLRSLETAYVDLLGAKQNARNLYLFFGIGYIQIAVLLLLLAAQLIFDAAERVTSPIRALVKASHSVRKGNLNTRVPLPEFRDEVRTLSRSFNAMTGQLSEQRTALFAAKEDVSERNTFLETLLSAINAGVITLDERGYILSVNPSAQQILGWNDSVIGEAIGKLAPSFSVMVGTTLQTGQPCDETLEFSSKSETNFLRVKTAYYAGGCIITIDDLTRQVLAQRQAAWRDVARRIAHEIRNPLTPIQLSAERLQRRFGMLDQFKNDSIFENCTTTILRQVDELGRLVKNFSAFATMPKPERVEFDIASLLENVVFSHVISFPNVEFKLEKSSAQNSEFMFVGDDRLLGQMFSNLITNAAQAIKSLNNSTNLNASDAGYAFGQVVVSLIADGNADGVTICIDDNGPGFPETEAEALFQPYVTNSPEGTGLGLSIAQRVVADHGGWISLGKNDKFDKGARVMVFLPHERVRDDIPHPPPFGE